MKLFAAALMGAIAMGIKITQDKDYNSMTLEQLTAEETHLNEELRLVVDAAEKQKAAAEAAAEAQRVAAEEARRQEFMKQLAAATSAVSSSTSAPAPSSTTKQQAAATEAANTSAVSSSTSAPAPSSTTTTEAANQAVRDADAAEWARTESSVTQMAKNPQIMETVYKQLVAGGMEMAEENCQYNGSVYDAATVQAFGAITEAEGPEERVDEFEDLEDALTARFGEEWGDVTDHHILEFAKKMLANEWPTMSEWQDFYDTYCLDDDRIGSAKDHYASEDINALKKFFTKCGHQSEDVTKTFDYVLGLHVADILKSNGTTVTY